MSDKTASSIKAEKAARQALELKQEGAELSPARPYDLTYAHLRLGIDVGSTTVKLAVIDDNDNLIYANYERHHTDVRATAKELFIRAQRVIGDAPMRVSITGSGGMLLAKWLGLEFVQEVIASKRAVETLIPQTDCAIELGGEDAKIIYFDNGIEQRMNGTCAGGTGAFIDQMASLLHTDATGLNELAKGATRIHPIASRCGVFAKTDVQPLLNEGARPEDVAASIFQAVANQTVSGLACGHPIRGYVAFLGGPLQYLSELRHRFYVTLNLDDEHIIVPNNAHLFVATGAALAGESDKRVTFAEVIRLLEDLKDTQGSEVERLDPLFATEDDYREFKERHDKQVVPKGDLATYHGRVFIGIDAGSTTMKAAVVGEDGELLYTWYGNNNGDILGTARTITDDIYDKMPSDCVIGHVTTTGYGEQILIEALRAYEEAKAAGAVALFGEKYGDVVRVVSVGTEDKPFSRELCGGTHARNTAELGFFKIVSESSVGSHARRIEAVTSAGALEYVDERLAEMDEVAAALKCRPADVMARVEQLKDEKAEAEKKLKAALVGGSSNQVADAVGSAVDMGAYKLVVAHLSGISGKELRNVWDTVRDKIGSDCACVLASEADGKVGLLAAATDGAVSAGFSAGDVVKQISGLVGGKGGGRCKSGFIQHVQRQQGADAVGVLRL